MPPSTVRRGLATALQSDAHIAAAARELLAWTCMLPGGPLMISVERGWLTLSGKAEWAYQKQAAEEGVERLEGLAGLSNQITLQPTPTASAMASGAPSSAPAAILPHDNPPECDIPL